MIWLALTLTLALIALQWAQQRAEDRAEVQDLTPRLALKRWR